MPQSSWMTYQSWVFLHVWLGVAMLYFLTLLFHTAFKSIVADADPSPGVTAGRLPFCFWQRIIWSDHWCQNDFPPHPAPCHCTLTRFTYKGKQWQQLRIQVISGSWHSMWPSPRQCLCSSCFPAPHTCVWYGTCLPQFWILTNMHLPEILFAPWNRLFTTNTKICWILSYILLTGECPLTHFPFLLESQEVSSLSQWRFDHSLPWRTPPFWACSV